MEAHLEKSIREVMNQPSVTGAMCIDGKGLCLIAKGTADPTAAGFLYEISRCSNQLTNSAEGAPVVAIEFSKTQILIKHGQNITTVIYKEKPK
ncbi:ragulator complex protein LAMTOR5 homolog [Paramacrobiotus metropolitanus]|uniref:ragulator complex protein LAMTOR5 homolog n=1 Tax=Paramacrobiotus metropolitanus TaxID=2943436 RepID=UPI002445BC88|nr:ragulator complex protein LAMTOR5 homolog [Paramacrobiotus metropolitanus]XP_055338065.1 ragulator complex protein LAMTOR5 homolog [Paramacrobiotus metropolitanus]